MFAFLANPKCQGAMCPQKVGVAGRKHKTNRRFSPDGAATCSAISELTIVPCAAAFVRSSFRRRHRHPQPGRSAVP
jgi:hypothetical protein